MAAVSTLVDRIYRDFLNKPDDLSAFSRLDGAMKTQQVQHLTMKLDYFHLKKKTY